MCIRDSGNKNDPGVDIMSIVAEHDIRTEWPEDALEQANAIPDHVTEEERHEAGRRDITDQPAVTIDGDDSKDFDDAVVLWKLDNGNTTWASTSLTWPTMLKKERLWTGKLLPGATVPTWSTGLFQCCRSDCPTGSVP